MTKKSGVPAIRFKGFTDTWEQRELGECADLLTGYPFESKSFSSEGILLIRGMNVKRNQLDCSPDLCEYWHTIEGLDKYLLAENDILIQMDGALIGKSYAKMPKNRLPALLVQRVTRARITQNTINTDFIYQCIQRNFLSYIKAIKTETAVPHLSLSDIEKFPIFLPTTAEQEAVGSYFRNLDSLITLHQRKLEKLHKLKRAMLERMFPKNGSAYPEIRFAGFTDAWEQREFNSVFTMLQNNTLSRAELVADNGAAMNVHYGDILVKFGEVLDLEIEALPYIESEPVVSKFKSSYLQNGDVIVADTAEDEAVGKCTEIANLSDVTVISGLHTIPLRPQQKFASGYLGYYLNSNSYHDTLIPLMQGTKVTSISKSALQGTSVCYPVSYEEQQQIGTYFRNLDNLITLHQRKLEKLQNIKKSMLKKMFV